ncbi:hypothetical protein KC345_g6249 [Hortaea werneckii]|nr:hypothetical protein KC345_g6249 [Hortaea werneckii]
MGQWTSVPSTFVTPRLPSTTPTWPGMAPVCETRATGAQGIAVTSIRQPNAGQASQQSGPLTAASVPVPQTTAKVQAGQLAQRIKEESVTQSSVDPLTYNSVVVGAPVCAVTAVSVKLLYWPVSTASDNDCQNTVSTMTMGPTIAGKPNTFVLRNTTLTSPTVYMEFDGTWAYENNGTMVTSESRLLLPHNSTDVSSLCGRTGAWDSLTLPVNYADFNHPVPASAYRCQQKCFWESSSAIYSTSYIAYGNTSFPSSSILSIHSTWPTENLCTTIWDDFAPQLAIPAAFSTIAPVMEVGNGISCTFTFNSDALIYDPPSALTQASSLVMPSAPEVTTTSRTLLPFVPTTKAPEPSSLPQPSVPTATTQLTSPVNANTPGGGASADQDSDPSLESQATMSELPTASFDETPSAERTMAPLVRSSEIEIKSASRSSSRDSDATDSASDETGSRVVGESLVSGMGTHILASRTSADIPLSISTPSDGTEDATRPSFRLSKTGSGANIAGIIASVLGATQAQNGYSDAVEAPQSGQAPAAAISSTTNLAPMDSQPSQSMGKEQAATSSNLDKNAESSPEKKPTSTSTLTQSTSILRSAFPRVSTFSNVGSTFPIKENSGLALETGVSRGPGTHTEIVSSKTIPLGLSRSLTSSNGASQAACGTQVGPYAVIPFDGQVNTGNDAQASRWQSEMTLRPGHAVTISKSTFSFPPSASFVVVNGVSRSIVAMHTSSHGREENATTTEIKEHDTSSANTQEYASSGAYTSESTSGAGSAAPTASADSSTTQSLPVINTAIIALFLAMTVLL